MVFPTAEQRLEQKAGDEPTNPSVPVKANLKPPVDTSRCHRTQLLQKLGIAQTAGDIPPASSKQPARSLLGKVNITTEPLKYSDNFHRTLQEKHDSTLKRSSSSDSLFSAFSSMFIGGGGVGQSEPPKEKEEESEEAKQQEDEELGVEVDRDDGESFRAGSVAETDTESSTSSVSSVSKRRGITFNDEVTVVPIPKRGEYSKRIRDHLWMNARDLQTQVARNTVEFASEGWDWKNALEDDEMYVCAVSGEKVHPVHCELED